jgi:hypothetical protein
MTSRDTEFNLILTEFNDLYYQLNNFIYKNDTNSIHSILEKLIIYYYIFNEYMSLTPDVVSLYLRKMERLFKEYNVHFT